MGSIRCAFGLPHACTSWQARLLVIETPSMGKMLHGIEGSGLDIRFAKPHRRDALLARRFIELHRALETTSWRLECETLLMEWLRAAADLPERCESRGPRAAIPCFGEHASSCATSSPVTSRSTSSPVPPASAGIGWGERHGQLTDPFGYRWNIAQRLRDVPHDEIVAAAAQAFGAG